MFKQKKSLGHKIETLIGKETSISGSLESKGSIRIDGSFQGDITVESDVIVGESAMVRASINCTNIILAGRVEGDVCTSGKLDLRATGVLIGDAKIGSLAVEDGAVLAGNCKMSFEDKQQLHGQIFEKNTDKKEQEDGKKDNPGSKDSQQKTEGKDHKVEQAGEKGKGKKR